MRSCDDYDTCIMMNFMPRPVLNEEGGSGLGRYTYMYACTRNLVVISKLTSIYSSRDSNV